jgi:hypothetical protein
VAHGGGVDVTQDERPDGGGTGTPIRQRISRGWRGVSQHGETVRALEERVARLEEELAVERRMQRQVAELTDVVMQILLSPEQRDEVDIARRLERYAEEL